MTNPQLDTDYYPVHLGLWTNWSRGAVFGQTLTLSRRDGGLLIAFTALFVSFVSTRGWKILAFALHRYCSSSSRQRAAYHQSQAILRNCDIQASIFQFTNILLANFRAADLEVGKSKARQPFYTHRLAFILLLAVVYTTAFTVAGGLSSQISTAVGSEVLIRSANCGWDVVDNSSWDRFYLVTQLTAGGVGNAANYAQQCYSNDSVRVLDCSRLMARAIPTQIDTHAPCPFVNKDICLSSNSSIHIDTGYVDSLDTFGLNTSPDGKVLLRMVADCAPMKTEGYTSRRKMPSARLDGKDVEFDNVTVYHYGNITTPTGVKDYIATVQSFNSQYSYVLSSDTTAFNSNYNLLPLTVYVENGTAMSQSSDFLPLDSIFPMNADINVVFLSGNGVIYTTPSQDEWYRVSPTSSRGDVIGVTATGNQEEFYLPSEEASPLACMTKFQFCIQDQSKCGVLGGYVDAENSARLLLNTIDQSTNFINSSFDYFAKTIRSTRPITGIVATLGATSLESQTSLLDGSQGPLASNQWQLDVIRWFNIALADIQLLFLNAAYSNPADSSFLQVRKYATDDEHILCGNQKIKSTAYTSFSLFGLLFTYLFGFLVIVTSFSIEPLFWLLYKKCGYNPYATLEWTTNTTLQLQRLAHEGIGLGTWSKGTDKVPVTQADDLLGCLDLTTMSHPVLGSQVVQGHDGISQDETLENETQQSMMVQDGPDNSETESSLDNQDETEQDARPPHQTAINQSTTHQDTAHQNTTDQIRIDQEGLGQDERDSRNQLCANPEQIG
ncbi:hypothetical protein GGR57DRAFT_513738 [Xylariaceae sp. FL1272]|nr:hypothetical protein GGR57DRAFT_513738 [Xylariaceae sp. FL1272]